MSKITKESPLMNGFEESHVTTDSHFVTRLPDPEKVNYQAIYSRVNDKEILFSAFEAINLFREEKNKAAGLAAFVFFLEAGLYPPDDLLEWLADGFTEWVTKDGKSDLEKILKLSKQVSGNTPSLKSLGLIQRNIEIANELRMLIRTFAYSQEKAAEMVAARMKHVNDPLAISADTILREVFPWKKKREKGRGHFFQDFDENEKKQILKRYPIK